MSTDYVTVERISFADVFDGRLKRFGVEEHIHKDASDIYRCLTDGRNYLWAYATSDEILGGFERCGANAPGRILEAIAETFDTDIFSEHEPQFWGFDNQEEWDLALKEMAQEHDDEFYTEIIRYVAGEKNDLTPGTIGMIKADIAKDLVAETPRLVLPEKKTELMAAIDQIYQADHAVVIKLDDVQIAAAEMAMTHEDDLPQS